MAKSAPGRGRCRSPRLRARRAGTGAGVGYALAGLHGRHAQQRARRRRSADRRSGRRWRVACRLPSGNLDGLRTRNLATDPASGSLWNTCGPSRRRTARLGPFFGFVRVCQAIFFHNVDLWPGFCALARAEIPIPGRIRITWAKCPFDVRSWAEGAAAARCAGRWRRWLTSLARPGTSPSNRPAGWSAPAWQSWCKACEGRFGESDMQAPFARATAVSGPMMYTVDSALQIC